CACVAAEDGKHRNTHPLGALQGGLKHRRFSDRQPDVEAEQNEHGAGQKWKPPAEGEELRVGEPAREQQESSARKQEAERRSELREHAIKCPLMRWSVFD